MKKTVAIGFLGNVLDRIGKGAERWTKWRPSIGLCQQDDLIIDRLELLHGENQRDVDLAARIKADIYSVSPETEVCLHSLSLNDPWDFEEVYESLYQFVNNYQFNTEQEDYLIHITTGTHVAQICWFLLAEAHFVPARLVQTSPAKRSEADQFATGKYAIIDLDLSRYSRIVTRFQQEQEKSLTFLKAGIATRNKAFNHSIEQIERIAIRSQSPMLLMGPTGAGKSFLAHRIYQLKHNKHLIQGPFIEINCATLRGDSAMSTLFGHVKGAFTGALQAREGLLRAANNGMLFLDEIGELGADEQAMLLKAIEEKRFLPLGGDKEVMSDFLLIAGTHRDLRQQVSEGLFREDLLARINLWTFELPGLAKRLEDIEPNIDFELARFMQTTGQSIRFNTEARHQYLSFATSPAALWRGNFRELSASITRMATLADTGRITEQLVSEEINRLQQDWLPHQSKQGTQSSSSILLEKLLGDNATQLDLFDRCQLITVLETCVTANSLSEAGRKLFAVSRQQRSSVNDSDRLKKYLARFELTWADIQAISAD